MKESCALMRGTDLLSFLETQVCCRCALSRSGCPVGVCPLVQRLSPVFGLMISPQDACNRTGTKTPFFAEASHLIIVQKLFTAHFIIVYQVKALYLAQQNFSKHT